MVESISTLVAIPVAHENNPEVTNLRNELQYWFQAVLDEATQQEIARQALQNPIGVKSKKRSSAVAAMTKISNADSGIKRGKRSEPNELVGKGAFGKEKS
jgi:hypothetical protein